MKKWLRKIVGADVLELQLQQTQVALVAQMEKQAETDQKLLDQQKEKDQPKCTIVSEGISADGQVYFELDWNDAFVNHLKENKYVGVDDEDIVNQWLNSIMVRFSRPEMIDNGADALQRERDDQ